MTKKENAKNRVAYVGDNTNSIFVRATKVFGTTPVILYSIKYHRNGVLSGKPTTYCEAVKKSVSWARKNFVAIEFSPELSTFINYLKARGEYL